MKKLFSILFALCLSVSAWAETFESGGINYNITTGTNVEVVAKTGGYSGAITIPTTTSNGGTTYNVIGIAEDAFNADAITSVVIPSSIQTIGYSAFENCPNLASVEWNIADYAKEISFDSRFHPFSACNNLATFTFGDNVINIPAHTCYNLDGLKTVKIGADVESIGSFAFADCERLNTVNIPNYLTSIGNAAFINCGRLATIDLAKVKSIGEDAFKATGLTTIILPNSIQTIGYSAFENCTSLESVHWNIANYAKDINSDSRFHPFSTCNNLATFTFGDNVINIPANACYNFIGLTTANIGESVETIGSSAFANCSRLSSVNIPNSVKTIGQTTFYNCGKLSSIKLGSGVETIGQDAFNSSGLTSITLPNSIQNINYSAFENCLSLKSVEWNIANYPKDISNDSRFHPFSACNNLATFTFGNNVTYIPANVCYGLIGLTTINIGENVETIGNAAFAACSYLNNVNTPNFLTTIGNSAFSNCTRLSNVTISNSVKTIGSSAFFNCGRLTNINLANVTTIGEDAFNTTGLTSITLPNTIQTIGYSAFENCTSLESVHWNIANYAKDINSDSRFHPFSTCNNLTTFAFGENVIYIPANICYNFIGLTTINIGANIETIGGSAFANCSRLSSVNIPNSVEIIGQSAFYNCGKLTSIELGNSVETIGQDAFNSSGLTSIILPSSIQNIGYSSFENCSDLASVEWNIVNYANDINSDYRFHPFNACNNLTTFSFGTNVLGIPANMCYNLIGLTKVTMLENVANIGGSAFGKCVMLTDVTCMAVEPPTLGANVFSGVPTDKATLKVPTASIPLYDEREQWTDFFSIATDIEQVFAPQPFTQQGSSLIFDSEENIAVYSISGQCVYQGITQHYSLPNNGIYIVVTKSGKYKVAN